MKCMRGDGFRDADSDCGPTDGALDDGLVQMVAATLAGDGIDVRPRGREDPLPRPFPRGARILGLFQNFVTMGSTTREA